MLLNIKNKRQYVAEYDSALLRGVDDPNTPRPWDLFEEIKEYASPDKTLLDLGCGTAFKLFPLAPYFKEVIGIDPSQSMLDAAIQNAGEKQIKNIRFLNGVAESLSFPDHSVDVITSMLSRWNTAELKRVLKPDGVAIVEFIGCEDKKAFKQLFGADEQGPRGQFIEYHPDEYLEICRKDFSSAFNSVSIKNGFWDTYYSPEGLNQLLSFTPCIRNYDSEKDQEALAKALEMFKTDKGIKLTQNRVLVHAKNI